jgi:pimeloyl-ACP methyl ester carboxylesterase
MIWDGPYMWAWMVFDSLRALDYLCAREDVDAGRIGAVGMSMGSSMAQWVAALDERIRACVDICCLTNFDEFAAERRFDEHGIYYYIPGLRRKFTTSQLNALIAPRAHFSIVGRFDPLTPPRGVDRDEREIRDAYEELGAAENWALQRYPVGHVETEEMRTDALRFFEMHLLQ